MATPELSLMFYNYICDVIGTEEVVRMRRHIFTTIDNVNGHKGVTQINSGSKAEGLDLDGSDVDIMLLNNIFLVFENNDDIIPNPNTIPLVIDTQECKPGFTRLEVFNNENVFDSLNCCIYVDGKTYLSSTLWRDYYRLGLPGLTTHGPCNSTLDGHFDLVRCVRCKKWTSQSKSWISRSTYLFTSKNVINAIIEFGVLFVPIGCKNSRNVNLEWRISFSYAEKLLIWSFNHVQLLCYALLKILLKEVIKETTGDMLCSYFLKTIMLWISEETKPLQWKPNKIISCFMTCLDRLTYCVRHKSLPHYFIPDNDLFAERFNKEQHIQLLSKLNAIRGLGWTCLLQTQTLKSFKSLLVPAPSYHLIPQKSYYASLLYLFVNGQGGSKHDLKRIVNFCLRANVKDFYLIMIALINQRIGQTLSIENNSQDRNKQSHNIIRKRLCHLLIGLNSDAISGWLLFASHFYVNKQYTTCQVIISHCLLRCMPDMFMIVNNPSNEEQTRFTRLQKALRIKPLSMIRQYMVEQVLFQPSSDILPEELHMLADGTDLYIPQVVYGCFLKYLCAHRLGNQSEKDICLRELQFVIENKYFIINDYGLHIAYILLSVAYYLRDVVINC